MAFTYCTNCGEKIDDSVERCPHCNHPKGIDRVYGYESESFGKKNNTDQENGQKNPWENDRDQSGQNHSYGQGDNQNGNGQNPYGQNGNPYGNGQNPYGQNRNPWENGQGGAWGQNNPYGQNPYGQNGNPYGGGQSPYGQNPYGQGGYQPWQPREKRNLSIGLVIFSVINILLGTCCAGSIFGIIGLVFAITARDAASEAEEIRRKKISLAINIIAVVLTVVFVISFAVGFFQGGGIDAFFQQQ